MEVFFEVMYSTVSGMQIKYVKCINGHKIFPWVRYKVDCRIIHKLWSLKNEIMNNKFIEFSCKAGNLKWRFFLIKICLIYFIKFIFFLLLLFFKVFTFFLLNLLIFLETLLIFFVIHFWGEKICIKPYFLCFLFIWYIPPLQFLSVFADF